MGDFLLQYCSFDLKSPSETISSISACISVWFIRRNFTYHFPMSKVFWQYWTALDRQIPSDSCKSLRVMLDSHFTIEWYSDKAPLQISSFSSSQVRSSLSTVSATEQLVHSLVTSYLNYCNSLLVWDSGISERLSTANAEHCKQGLSRNVTEDHILLLFLNPCTGYQSIIKLDLKFYFWYMYMNSGKVLLLPI